MGKYCLILFIFFAFPVKAQLISTYAGTGTGGYAGDGSAATSAKMTNPHCVAFDKLGNLYFGDEMGCVVRKIDTAGIISTVAGTGIPGYGGDNGPASLCVLKFPEGVACDTAGNLFISDHQNFRIRKVDVLTGIITTIAGTGVGTDGGDNGPASSAQFFPSDIHFDSHGNLYIADGLHNKVRKINATGIISTYAGTGTTGFSGDGNAATAATLHNPLSLAIDSKGNLFITDDVNLRVRKVDTFGIITTVAGNGLSPYVGDGMPATIAQLAPITVSVDRNDNLFIADSNVRIRMIDGTGIIHTVVGTGVPGYNGDEIPATTAEINGPGGIAFDACNNMFFADAINRRIRKVTYSPSCNPQEALNINQQEISKINIFPNPAYDELAITAGTTIKSITMYNLVGQVMLNRETDDKEVRINISGMAAGVYFVKVNGAYAGKFVKQ